MDFHAGDIVRYVGPQIPDKWSKLATIVRYFEKGGLPGYYIRFENEEEQHTAAAGSLQLLRRG
jgi:hypothetical protein